MGLVLLEAIRQPLVLVHLSHPSVARGHCVMSSDPQNTLDVTRRTDATTHHKGCVMTSPILVTGGTGRLGSHVVRRRWAKGVLDGRAALGVPTGPWQAP